jgi:hypothetical protein
LRDRLEERQSKFLLCVAGGGAGAGTGGGIQLPPPAAPEEHALSAYEQQRLANIERNKQIFINLILGVFLIRPENE